MVAACGPFGEFGPWHSRHITFAGFSRSALFSVPWTSWQLLQVTPCVYICALHEIVPLHAVLVRGSVGKMREGLLAQLVFFQLPEILSDPARLESRPANRSISR